MSRSHHYPKLKPPPRPLFSCGIFGNCTNSPLSPTTPPSTTAATVPPPSPPPPATPPPPSSLSHPSDPPHTSSSSSSSSSTSQSFTQWRFPLHHPPKLPEPEPQAAAVPAAAAASFTDLADAFRAAELHFSYAEPLQALRILAAYDGGGVSGVGGSACPPAVWAGVVAALRGATTARPAAKVLLALLLPEANRREAVTAGAATAAVETVAGASGPTAERALAALELMCTVPEGAAEVRGHALAAPVRAGAVEGMVGRGRECAIGVMAAIYGGEWAAVAPVEVARAVVVALQGECSARGRRKGAQLLRALQESGTVDLAADGY